MFIVCKSSILKKLSFILFWFSTPEICAQVNSYNLVMTNNIKLGQKSDQENVFSLYNCKWEGKDT